jgi:hypothetical protein
MALAPDQIRRRRHLWAHRFDSADRAAHANEFKPGALITMALHRPRAGVRAARYIKAPMNPAGI